MKFPPKTKEELAVMNLIAAGRYPFEIIAAKDTFSKSGNEMIAITLKIWDANNHERIVFDYLLEAMSFKLRHFAEATGLLEKYESGVLLASHCLGKSGYLDLIVQKDKTGQYPDKNAVKDYVTPDEHSKPAPNYPTTKPLDQENPPFDDDIPF